MRNLLITLLVLLVIVGVVGYARHWFEVTTSQDAGKVGVAVTVDKEAVERDQAEARRNLEEAGRRLKEQVRIEERPTEPAKVEAAFHDLSQKIDVLQERVEQLAQERTHMQQDLDELLKRRQETATQIAQMKNAQGRARDELVATINKNISDMRRVHDRLRAQLP